MYSELSSNYILNWNLASLLNNVLSFTDVYVFNVLLREDIEVV